LLSRIEAAGAECESCASCLQCQLAAQRSRNRKADLATLQPDAAVPLVDPPTDPRACIKFDPGAIVQHQRAPFTYRRFGMFARSGAYRQQRAGDRRTTGQDAGTQHPTAVDGGGRRFGRTVLDRA
jgi:hypothetical protein